MSSYWRAALNTIVIGACLFTIADAHSLTDSMLVHILLRGFAFGILVIALDLRYRKDGDTWQF